MKWDGTYEDAERIAKDLDIPIYMGDNSPEEDCDCVTYYEGASKRLVIDYKEKIFIIKPDVR